MAMDIRTGTGIDFHRLENNPGRPLLLGGVEVPGELALRGHSDADLVLHALADALYGAVARGDIGTHFPDTDPANRDMDSSLLVRAAMEEVRSLGFRLSSVDITLMGERPKVKPHREAIRNSLATILSLEVDRISMKATTTETMGALGREEGLGCFASVLIWKE